MPEKTTLTIATHVLALAAMAFAAFLQLGIILTLGVRLSPARIIGAVIVSSIVGGCATVIAQEYLHWPSFLAGVAGTLTGIIPAAISAGAITKKALERAGLDNAAVTAMLETMRTEATGIPQEAKTDV